MPEGRKKTYNLTAIFTGIFLIGAVFSYLSFLPSVLAATGINEHINFQGKVVNTDGTNVTNGSYTFLFCIYTTATPTTACTSGADNDAIWRESKSITVTDGIFQTNLGDTTTLPGAVDFNTDNIYLGINFNANGQMTPLVRFTAAPYALNAAKVSGLTVTDTTGTLTIPNAKTISFADAFTTSGAFATTLTSTGTTNVTLPTTGTLATLAGAETLTNKTIGSTGLTFSGATTDITTASGESLVITAAGAGTVDIQDTLTADSLTLDTGSLTLQNSEVIGNGTDDLLTFVGAGGTDNTDLYIDLDGTSPVIYSNTDDRVSIADFLNVQVSGVTGAAAGDIWYDSAANKFKINENGTTKIVCNTTDAGCGAGGSSTLQTAYDASSGNTILTTTGRNIAFTLGEVATPTSLTIENQDTAGVSAQRIFNSIASGTLTNGLLIEQTGAGTLTSGIQITETAGAITTGINIGNNIATGISIGTGVTTGISVGSGGITIAAGALAVNSDSITSDGALVINATSTDIQDAVTVDSLTTDTGGVSIAAGQSYTGAGAVTLSSASATGLTINSGTTGTIAIGDDASAETINIGTGAAAKTTVVGSTNTTSGTTINSGSGGITLVANGTTLSNAELVLLDGKTGTLIDDTDLTSGDGAGGTSSGSGMEAGTGGIGLIQGCANNEILKWNDTTSVWACAADSSGSGTSKFVVKGSNENVASGTTLQSDNDLTFAVASGETWIFDFVLRVTNINSATPDWKAAILGANGWTCSVTTSGTEPAGAAFPQATTTDCDAAPTAMVNSVIAADVSIPFQVRIQGSVTTNSAGSVTLQWAANTSGSLTVMAGSYVIAQKVGGSDLAEVYYTLDESVREGDVVSLDSTLNAGVKKSSKPYDSEAIGIISTKPGLLLGDATSDYVGRAVQVALAGRVPVSVSTENGVIRSGDLLTSSSLPGVAMRATKSGQIIGQAMTAYDGEGVGSVLAFIKTDYANGSKISDLIPDGLVEANIDIGKTVLEQLVTKKEQLGLQANFSEIITDRIAAGLEIITPLVTADQVALNTIEAATGLDVNVNVADSGAFKINNLLGKTGIVFDGTGNATFQGTVTADAIVANKILGLEIFTSHISTIDESVTMLNEKLESLATATKTPDLSSLGITEGKHGLVIAQKTTFEGETVFGKLVTLLGNVLFRGTVSFEKVPTFSEDTAGYAVIKEGDDRVRVRFAEKYTVTPIVNASLSIQHITDDEVRDAAEELLLISDVKFVVTNVTNEGFDIRIGHKTRSDIPFSWVALGVRDTKTFLSDGKGKQDADDKITSTIEEVPVTEESGIIEEKAIEGTQSGLMVDDAAPVNSEIMSTDVQEAVGEDIPLVSESTSEEILTQEITVIPQIGIPATDL